MALLPIQFRGLDESADPKTQPPGTLLVADNCRMDKARRLHKRWGTNGLVKTKVGGGSISAGSRLFEAADGGLGMIDGTYAYVYAEDAALWKVIDRAPHLNATKRPLVDGVKSAVCVDAAISGNLLVSVWMASDSQYLGGSTSSNVPIFAQVHDVTTWALVMPPTQMTTGGIYPRVVVNSGKAICLWSDSSGNLKYRDITLSTFTVGTAANLITGLVASSVFDVCVAGTTLYAACCLTSGTDRIRVQAFDTSYTSSIGPTDIGGSVAGLRSISINATTGENCYVAYGLSAAAELYLATLSASALALSVGPTLMASVAAFQCFAERDTSTTLLFGYTSSTGGRPFLTTSEVTGSSLAVTSNTTRTTYHVENPTRPWKISSRWYCSLTTLSVDGSTQYAPSSRIVVEVPLSAYSAATATHLHVATLENQTGADFSSDRTRYRSGGAAVSGSTAYLPSPYVRAVDETGDAVGQGANIAVLSETGDRFRMLRAGATTLLVGAAPGIYDGLTVTPYGFMHPPQIATSTSNTGSMATGTYQYASHFVRVGADGIMQRSMVSSTKTVTSVPASGSVALTFDSASVSGKLTETTGFANAACPVYVDIHRSLVGQSVLYKLTRAPRYNLALNDPTASTVSFTDTRADSNIGSGEALDARPTIYTDTELDDLPPPAATTGTVHRNRLWLIAADEFTLAASKDASEDLTIAPGFNEVLTLQFATRKKALASLDEKLVVFGADDIDVVFGDGPDSNGENNTWQISRVQTDAGCTNPRSVVVTPMGVAFLSRRGLELLDRGLNVTPIGMSVEDTLASYPTITSAVLVADEGEVRWTCNESDGTNGVVIVWDYLNKAWFVRKYKDAADTDTANVAFVDAALIDGVYTMLTSGGQVYREDKTTFLDDGTDYVERDVQIAHVSPAGPSAWHRFRRWHVLGTSVSNHDLKLSIARDYASTWEQDTTFAAEGDVTSIGPLQKARITPAIQKASAMRLRLQDLTPTTGALGSGAGPIWEALTLDYDIKRGGARTSAAEQA